MFFFLKDLKKLKELEYTDTQNSKTKQIVLKIFFYDFYFFSTWDSKLNSRLALHTNRQTHRQTDGRSFMWTPPHPPQALVSTFSGIFLSLPRIWKSNHFPRLRYLIHCNTYKIPENVLTRAWGGCGGVHIKLRSLCLSVCLSVCR